MSGELKVYEIKMTVKCCEQFYEEELKSLKKEIESGKAQRDFMRDRDLKTGKLSSVKMTFKEVK